MGIRKEKIRQKDKSSVKTGEYLNSAPGADLESPVNFPDVLGNCGRKLDQFGCEDRKQTFSKNLGIELTPSQLFAKANLVRKAKKNG